MTISGLLPPSSRVNFFSCLAQISAMCRPTTDEPVKVTDLTSGWPVRASPITAPLPSTTLKLPAGKPAS